MAKNFRKYKQNRDSLKALLYDDNVAELVDEKADELAEAAGDGFTARGVKGKSRYRASVWTESFSARVRDRRQNILVKTLEEHSRG